MKRKLIAIVILVVLGTMALVLLFRKEKTFGSTISATSTTFTFRTSKFNKTNLVSLNEGKVGHWTMDGADTTATTVTDRSGSGNNGTRTGGTTEEIGKIGQGMNFNGTNSDVTVGDISILESSGNFLTASAWIKTEGSPVKRMFVGKKDDNSAGYFMWVNGSGKFDAGFYSTSYFANPASTAVVNNNVWHHLVVVRNTDTVTLYIDGIQDGSATAAGTIGDISNTINFRIGRSDHSPPGPYYFPGSIDDVRVYNRALSATEIQQLYQMGI